MQQSQQTSKSSKSGNSNTPAKASTESPSQAAPQQQQSTKLSTMSTPPSVFSTPEPSQGMRMSLSALIDKGRIESSNPLPPPPSQTKPQSSSASSHSRTPQAKPKMELSSATLPFGLGDSSKLGGSSTSVSAMKKGGKLLKAAKTVQNMVKVTNVIATPRVPALSTAVEREDFDELLKRNDEYFARLLSSQAETFESLTDMVDALTKKLNESVKVSVHSCVLTSPSSLLLLFLSLKCSTDLVSKLSELDELIDEEKRKWKQQVCLSPCSLISLTLLQNEAEKNADVLGRTKELIRGNDNDNDSRYSEY
jgi:hypothetical protein